MGGNVKVNGISADPFLIDQSNRHTVVQQIQMVMSYVAVVAGLDEYEYSGSTRHLMSGRIPTAELIRYKSTYGDVDVMVQNSKRKVLEELIEVGELINEFTVMGVKRHGHELSVLIRDKQLNHRQLDFVFVTDPLSRSTKFLHWSDWEDVKVGIKGVHHKLLLNALGGEEYKFSITHGLRRREGDSPSILDVVTIKNVLLGGTPNESKMWSFVGLMDETLASEKIDGTKRAAIVEKFVDSCVKIKNVDHEPAIKYLKGHLCG